jgi:hypothetical protein
MPLPRKLTGCRGRGWESCFGASIRTSSVPICTAGSMLRGWSRFAGCPPTTRRRDVDCSPPSAADPTRLRICATGTSGAPPAAEVSGCATDGGRVVTFPRTRWVAWNCSGCRIPGGCRGPSCIHARLPTIAGAGGSLRPVSGGWCGDGSDRRCGARSSTAAARSVASCADPSGAARSFATPRSVVAVGGGRLGSNPAPGRVTGPSVARRPEKATRPGPADAAAAHGLCDRGADSAPGQPRGDGSTIRSIASSCGPYGPGVAAPGDIAALLSATTTDRKPPNGRAELPSRVMINSVVCRAGRG